MNFLKKNYILTYFDAVTQAGPIKVLTEREDKCRLLSLKEQIRISLEVNGSKFIAVVGHHDCRGNPVERKVQERQIVDSLEYLRKAYGNEITYVGLYVNDRWEVEEYTKIKR